MEENKKINQYNKTNEILERNGIEQEIKLFLQSYDQNVNDIHFKKGIYLYGPSGSGKTTFIRHILKSLQYDVIGYDASDTRNKTIIESITHQNISSYNIMNLFYKVKKKIIILMDDIESMNNNGGLSSLIKLIRQKKTKRQKNELQSVHPFICIGNCFVDKKIKELMKVCHVFQLSNPTSVQLDQILQIELGSCPPTVTEKIKEMSHGDLRKFYRIIQIHQKNPQWIFEHSYNPRCFTDDCKRITKTLLENPLHISKHNEINDTERTIVSLLWHENIPDVLRLCKGVKNVSSVDLYLTFLKNICFADYIDRITFQNQIWQFNEMSSLIKTMYNNYILHKHVKVDFTMEEIRFTKILTKYSTEYNNILFLTFLCDKLNLDKKDVLSFFQDLKTLKNDTESEMGDLDELLAVDITKLDIKRIFRFLEQSDNTREVEELIHDNDNLSFPFPVREV